MNRAELSRLEQYTKRIIGVQGMITGLNRDETGDLRALLLKWMDENGLGEGSGLGIIHRARCYVTGKLGSVLKDVAGSARGN